MAVAIRVVDDAFAARDSWHSAQPVTKETEQARAIAVQLDGPVDGRFLAAAGQTFFCYGLHIILVTGHWLLLSVLGSVTLNAINAYSLATERL